MRKVSRRGILAGLLATSAAPAASVEPDLPKPTFIKGMIMPRPRICTDPRYGMAGFGPAMVVYEYEIFDGNKFVPYNSDAGQRVVAELS